MIEEMTSDLSDNIRYVSHEIRNNLSICDMYTQIIKKNIENSNINNSSINNAIECIEKSLQIINSNLMDLKSLNVNTPQNIDFEQTVQKGINLAKACNEDKQISFEIFIKNTAQIYADENKLISCIINIIKNGIEAIENKGLITVIGEAKSDYCILKISNNGKIIPKDKWEKIFSKGYTSKNNGCGIGLGICKNYLESQNATLKLTKSTKAETTFEIKIPIFKI